MNYFKIIVLLLCFCFLSCQKGEMIDHSRTPFAEVANHYLYMDELQSLVPDGVSAEDSLTIIADYVRKWATEALLYERAQRNISDEAEINKLVEQYRRRLIIHQYQQNLVKERLGEMSEQETRAFYDQNKDKFLLTNAVVKGVFIKVPKGVPHYADLQRWFRDFNKKSVQNIEQYSIQNATGYEYFGDEWIYLLDLLKNTPIKVEDQNQFVVNHKVVEVNDSTHSYLMRISDYQTIGSPAPYDLAKPEVQAILNNKRKIDFIHTFEQELYQNAVDKKTINYFEQTEN